MKRAKRWEAFVDGKFCAFVSWADDVTEKEARVRLQVDNDPRIKLIPLEESRA